MIASDAKTKIIPVMQVGARNQEMAYSALHELKGRLVEKSVSLSNIETFSRPNSRGRVLKFGIINKAGSPSKDRFAKEPESRGGKAFLL